MSSLTLEEISQRFLTFARVEAHNLSPVYERLSLEISRDEQMLRLSSYAGPGQPVPNMLFAAVRFLQLKGDYMHLPYFGNEGQHDAPNSPEFYSSFREFCLQNEDVIKSILQKRRVQTNEIGRCACLLPAFASINRNTGGKAWNLVDVGASAGLNLNFDRYLYRYGATLWGDHDSKVVLNCQVRGESTMELNNLSFNIGQRIGIDISPIAVNSSEDVLWLRSLIWPNQTDREQRLNQALEIAKADTPLMIKGDALQITREILENSGSDDTFVFFSSFAFNQFGSEYRAKFHDLLRDYGVKRRVFLITMGFSDSEQVEIRICDFRNGEHSCSVLATCDPYGKWISLVNSRDTDSGRS